jgi:hypothetical protein
VGGIQYRSPLRCNWSLIGDTAMIDLAIVVSILVLLSGTIGLWGGYLLGRADWDRRIAQTRREGSQDYFNASQDFDHVDIET